MTITSSPATFRSDVAAADLAVDTSAPTGRDLALLARRAVARGLDMFTVLFLTLALVLMGLAPVMNSISTRWAPEPWGSAAAATLLYALVATVYETVFVALRGQTPGKDVCNVKVVDVHTGQPPGWGRALVRTLSFTLLRLIPGVVLGTAAPLLVGVPAVANRRGRSPVDLLARTIVIRHDADSDADGEADDGEVTDDGKGHVDRDALAATYGPRSVRDLVNRRNARP